MGARSIAPAVSARPPALERNRAITQRYEIREEIGRGGVAVVYRAVDRTSGREVALKGMREFDDPSRAQRAMEFFEREFHVLSQLSHPNVVEAYDYEVSPGGAFYTMELLVGDDLQATAPVPYGPACAWMADVCSALCLIHSRRLLHRDISPRNVLRVGDMTAKLIDFGALSPMGPNRAIVGTPPFCPPEVLNREALDARADLYSLGTTLYYLLTGRHAYPARSFRHLRKLWRTPPATPSRLGPQVPATLDALVMELIQLDPSERPDSAAEVMQRLTSIAGLPAREQLTASAAYLVTPTLVGRERLLSAFRTRLGRARQRRGRALAIAAVPGLGRTRALEACALEAKLAGATVLRADRLDAEQGDYGVARALCQQLLEVHPKRARVLAAPHSGLLSTIIPELAPKADPSTERLPERAQLQGALRDLMLAMGNHEPLALIIDDVDQIDEPSTALLALLASVANKHAITLLTSCKQNDPEVMTPGLRMLLEHSKAIGLEPLSAAECRALLGSVFGTPAHLELVATHLHRVSAGNPRDLMQLAQHLVSRGVARYAVGAWTLPAEIDAADLPDSLANAMAARVAGLSQAAITLARVLALAPTDRWSVDQCHRLVGHASRTTTLASLDELLTAGVVELLGQHYALAQSGWIGPLVADLDAPTKCEAHRRIAAVFEDSSEPFRSAQHLLHAGDHARGLDALVTYALESRALTNTSGDAYQRFLANLPADFEASYRRAIALCEELGRPAADAYALNARLCTALALGPQAWDVLSWLLSTCERDSGLDQLEHADPALDPMERIQRALGAATVRYEQLGPKRAAFAPKVALQELATLMVHGVGIVSSSNDRQRWKRLPVVEALAPLAPGFLIADRLRHSVGERLAGRVLSARAAYDRVLLRLAQPDRAGLQASYFTTARDGVILMRGLIECLLGSEGVSRAASDLEGSNLMGLGPLQLRMLQHLMHGEGMQADVVRSELEQAQVRSNIELRYESPMLVTELIAVALSDDLARLRRLIPHVERWARRADSWRPILHFALGEQRRIAGDFSAAMASHRRGLLETSAGEHLVWPLLAGSHVRCLLRLGRPTDAAETGRRYLAQAEAADIDFLSVYIRLPLAMALAERDEPHTAQEMADSVIAYLRDHGSAGLPLVLSYMVRARVCLKAGNADSFEAAMDSCREFFERCTTRSLTAKYKQMLRDGRNALRDRREGGITVSDFEVDSEAVIAYLTTAFETCQQLGERASLAAKVLADYCKSEELYLYVPAPDGPELAASIGSETPPSDVMDMVSVFLAAEAGDAEDVTATDAPDNDCEPMDVIWELDDGRRYRPTLLGHRSKGGFVITGVAVANATDQPAPNAERLASELSRIGLDTPEGFRTLVATTQLTDLTELA